jgi:two-component system chemotaxis response regulator CheB
MLIGPGIPEIERRRIEAVVIGASAGGTDALSVLLPALPANTPFPVIIVVHVPPRGPNALVGLFAKTCAIAVREAIDGETASAGTVWFAPPDYHLLVETDRTFALSVDAPESHSRPSIDALFESAADAYESSLLGIVLTGSSSDGAAGASAICEAGGLVVVQDPATAEMPTMPSAAIARARLHSVGPIEDIAALLSAIARARAT